MGCVLSGGLIVTLLGPLLLAWTATVAYNMYRLDAHGVQARAQVTALETSVSTGRGATRHWNLRYSFAVPGRESTYHASDDVLWHHSDDVWVDVPHDAWNRAREARQVKIEYLKDDPRINRVVDGKRGLGHVITFAALGLFCVWVAARLLRGVLRNRLRPPAHPAAHTSAPGDAPPCT